ncbi:MAG: LPS export ABC transporter permease LptF [Lamprobacter sp.]|uniref:LPS export ABC transporter permease LptF n=1 Tax=Lamprobacter sp. TaxID=3100796 RepID=UPI002B260DC8|nr:LPS export ABC transporter permease LptF [Lamprobacter sp.]MEA3639563.1 LPS export ABC transporter permease LptF [Lamprobacter sp.]
MGVFHTEQHQRQIEHNPIVLSVADRYLLTEITKIFSAIILTLLMVMVSILLLGTLEDVNLGALSNTGVLRYLGLQILRDTSSLLPPAFFIAALVTLGRLARDSELIAFGACGFGPIRLYRAFLLFALPLSVITGWFALFGQPYASLQLQIIESAKGEPSTQVAGLRAGRFYQQDDGNITFYAASIDDQNRFQGVFIQDRRAERPRLVISERGLYQRDASSGEQRILLEQGRRYDGIPGTADYDFAEFDRYTYFLGPDRELDIERRRRAARPTRELIGSDSLLDRAELGHRLSAPVAIYVLALIAIPLTSLSPRQRGTGRMLLAFLAYFAFFNLQRLAENWLESGITPAWMGMLWYQAAILLMVYLSLAPGSFWLRQLRDRFWNRSWI